MFLSSNLELVAHQLRSRQRAPRSPATLNTTIPIRLSGWANNSHMFLKRTCSLAAASCSRSRLETTLRRRVRTGNHSQRTNNSGSETKSRQPLGRRSGKALVHIISNRQRRAQLLGCWPVQTISLEINIPAHTQPTTDPKQFPPALESYICLLRFYYRY